MNYIALGELLLFTFFIVRWRLRYGPLGSVSAYYYELNGRYEALPQPTRARGNSHKDDFKDRSSEFMTCMGLTGISMWFYPTYTLYNNAALLCFIFAGLFLFLVAAAGNFKDDFIAPLHYTGAIGAIACGFGGLWLQYPNSSMVPYLLVFFVVASLILRKISANYTYWQELLAFYTLIPLITITPLL